MISYGGVHLSVPDAETSRRIAASTVIEEICEFRTGEWTGWPGHGWQAPEVIQPRQVRLGRLYWPRSASRFAIGHFLATEDQLDRIRRQAYTNDSRGQVALDLVISSRESDDLLKITAPMWMLAPRPLFQFENDDLVDVNGSPIVPRNLYLLTLVDERYWWWYKGSSITITDGMTWTELYNEIGSALDVTIEADEISEEYLKPPKDLECRYDYLPLLLDAVAASVGQRIVRKLDGTVLAQNPDEARTESNRLLNDTANWRHFGGEFNLDPNLMHADLVPLVPDTVRIIFPVYPTSFEGDPSDPCQVSCRPAQKMYDRTLLELDIDQYGGAQTLVKRGVKIIRSTAVAWGAGSSSGASATVDNDTELRALCRNIATNWYKWQLGRAHLVLSGIHSWEGEARSDFIEWTAYPAAGSAPNGQHEMTTYVCRESLHDLMTELYHKSTRPSSSSSSSSGETCDEVGVMGGINFRYVPNFNAIAGTQILAQVEGCWVWLDTTECPPESSSSGA